ncbi:hypothetical protein C2G38_2078958 [Gigaspora rosea]|uniref:Uncharacterized protein n=1 Tax=Gigaspora rosea TaxID=44941 RepID=A0A397VFC6_9GLOM|nr:hypothetical protein C2G38_2078958 [Gigaspora rosea]
MSFNCGDCNGKTLPNVQVSTTGTLLMVSNIQTNMDIATPDHSIISKSIVDQLTIFFSRKNFQHYVECMGRSVEFILPTVDYVLNIGGGKKKPPTSFILFRKIIQDCVSSLGLRIPRDKLSKHIQQIWLDLKKKIPQLAKHLKNVTSKALRSYNNSNRKFLHQTYPKSRSSTKNTINVNHSNADSREVNNLLQDLFPAIL